MSLPLSRQPASASTGGELSTVAASLPLGTVISSMLTLAQFQAQIGGQWVMADGSSCTGTAYATLTGFTVLPDARGMILRGKNNTRADGNQNPTGDVALGTFQDHGVVDHVHNIPTTNVNGAGGGYISDSVRYGAGPVVSGIGNNISSPAGAAQVETRMRNITVNHFIRIN